ncbi:uncharacterized protein [Watersipora subatra]|uniref:uncharacterized protein n=1 Tax=Watersipora subatra TaxID=2589382 RepID=UPI00355AE5B9
MAAPMRTAAVPTLRVFRNSLFFCHTQPLCQKVQSQEPPIPSKEKDTLTKEKAEVYNCKETQYYKHNPFTYYDFEVEMRSGRLPQPSSLN